MTDVLDLAGAVAQRVRHVLPPQESWGRGYGYPNSLALCVIDAVFSIGVRYQGVENVRQRYATFHGYVGWRACRDGAVALRASFSDAGSSTRWAQQMGNRQRAWSRQTAPLKADVVLGAAELLVGRGVDTTAELALAAQDPELEQRWRRLPGQRSGISWRYLLMLAQVPGVKPDRMISRFVREAAGGEPVAQDLLVPVVEAAAAELQVSPTVLDHAIWQWQSGRTRTPA